MTPIPARQLPQNQGDAAGARTDSPESGARSSSIAVQAILAINQDDANDAAGYILAPLAEIGSGNDGNAVL